MGIARLNQDGSLDASFDPGVGAQSEFWYENVAAVALANDGKVVIAGAFSKVNGAERQGVARLNSNGSLDTAFQPDAQWRDVRAGVLDSVGRFLIAGVHTGVHDSLGRTVTRLHTDFPPTLGRPLRVADGSALLQLNGLPGRRYVLQASSDLSSWQSVMTNVATNCVFDLSDPGGANHRQRFYRAVELGP